MSVIYCVFILEKGINNLLYEIQPSDSEPIKEEGLSPVFGTCMVILEGSPYMSKRLKILNTIMSRICLRADFYFT